MRWPVSRDRLDAMQRLLDIAHAEARQERSIADARYDALLEKYQSLKVAGAVEVPAPKPGVDYVAIGQTGPLPPVDDEMRELIDEKAGENPRVRRMMLRQLAKDRRANVSDDKIRDAILNGVPSDGVPA